MDNAAAHSNFRVSIGKSTCCHFEIDHTMALTSKARQAALWKRAQHRASSQSGCKCVLRRAAECGGLGRASYPERSRQADDLHAQRSGGVAGGSGERGSRSKGWRKTLASTWGVASSCLVCPAFDVTCGTCGDLL